MQAKKLQIFFKNQDKAVADIRTEIIDFELKEPKIITIHGVASV